MSKSRKPHFHMSHPGGKTRRAARILSLSLGLALPFTPIFSAEQKPASVSSRVESHTIRQARGPVLFSRHAQTPSQIPVRPDGMADAARVKQVKNLTPVVFSRELDSSSLMEVASADSIGVKGDGFSKLPAKKPSNGTLVFNADTDLDSGTESSSEIIQGDGATRGISTIVFLLNADFEDGMGGGSPDGFNTNGLWRIGDNCQAATTETGVRDAASFALMYNQSTTCNYDTGSANMGSATVTIDLTSAIQPMLSFVYFNESENTGPYDYFSVDLFASSPARGIGSGPLLTNIATDHGGGLNANAVWTDFQFDLTPYAGQNVDLVFTFDTFDELINSIYGPAVDNVIVTDLADDDGDGVPNTVEDAGPNFGDGNGDSTPDALQSNVASLPNAVDGGYITAAAPDGAQFENVSAIADPSAPGTPTPVFPQGFLDFSISNLSAGASIQVDLLYENALPSGLTYYKHDDVNGFRTFPFDGTTGAVFVNSTEISLFLQDGARGDFDGSANGVIVDPSGPGEDPETAVELVDFSATTTRQGAVRIVWETSAEINNSGFLIYAAEEDGTGRSFTPGEVLTPEIIPAKGSETQGAIYTYTDRRTDADSTRGYFLEDISTSGVGTFHGPVFTRSELQSSKKPTLNPGD